jgi:hypothetical protein
MEIYNTISWEGKGEISWKVRKYLGKARGRVATSGDQWR